MIDELDYGGCGLSGRTALLLVYQIDYLEVQGKVGFVVGDRVAGVEYEALQRVLGRREAFKVAPRSHARRCGLHCRRDMVLAAQHHDKEVECYVQTAKAHGSDDEWGRHGKAKAAAVLPAKLGAKTFMLLYPRN